MKKAGIVARMLSGRYRTDRLTRHWNSDNPQGLCRLPECTNQEGDLAHILLECSALANSRRNMIKLWSNFRVSKQQLLPIVHKFTIQQPQLLLQFLFDPSCLPLVISTNQVHQDTLKHCLFLGRTWCFSAHLARSRFLQQMNLR